MTAKKIKDFFSKCDQILGKFTEEILNGKLHFLCSVFESGRLILSRSRRICEKINQSEKTVQQFENSSSYTAVTAIRIIPLPKVNIKIFHADS